MKPTKQHIKALVEWSYQGAKKTIEAGSDVVPVLFCVHLHDDGGIAWEHAFEVGVFMASDLGKSELAGLMRTLVQRKLCDVAVLINEAWLAEIKLDVPLKPGTRPELTDLLPPGVDSVEDLPGRKEVVVAHLWHEGGAATIHHMIKRNPNQVIRGNVFDGPGIGRFCESDVVPPNQPDWARDMIEKIERGEDPLEAANDPRTDNGPVH